MRIVAANRDELWVSMAVVDAALFYSMLLGTGRPTFIDLLICGGALVVGLVCAVNAALDLDEMGPVETWVAVFWLIAMMILTPLAIHGIATLREFPNR